MAGVWMVAFIVLTQVGCRSAAPVRIEINRDTARIQIDHEPFTTYHAIGPRPCLYPVRSASGQAITRDIFIDPDPKAAQDHPHHVSLWFAHGDVNGHDFWHGDVNRIKTVSMEAQGDVLVLRNEWLADGGEVICTEDRRVTFAGDHETRTIDFEITLRSADGPLRLGDTKEGSLAIRLAPGLRLDHNQQPGAYLTSEGLRDRAAWGSRAKWVAASGLLDEPVTVVILDHPDNPNHPTWWHARPYGLFAANPFGRRAFEGADAPTGAVMALDGVPITFRYRVLILDEPPVAADLEQRWQRWAERSAT